MTDGIDVTEEKKDHSHEVTTVSEESPESSDTTVNNEHPSEDENDQPPKDDYNSVDVIIDSVPQLSEVDIDDIIRFDLIPDYITNTSSKYPYLVNTPKGTFCIDGYNLVEEANTQGRKKIIAQIESWILHSDDELSRRKIELRNASDYGKVYYIETMRHIAYRKKSLLEQRKELIEFRQGMSGKGIDNSSKLHYWLAMEKNMDSDTVSKYLTDIRYMSMEALDTLIEFQKKSMDGVERYPNKKFFEVVRPKKVNYIDAIEPLKLGYDENERLVSEKILDAYAKYRNKLKIEEFSDTLQNNANMIKSISADLLKHITENDDPVKDNTADDKKTTEENDEADKGSKDAESSADDEIKELAEALWKLADEQINKDEKKEKYNDFANRLLLIVARI